MLKEHKNIIIFTGIIFLIIGGILFYFLGVKKNQWIKLPGAPSKTAEYSYENIIYNFWGFVQEKQGDTILVEGVIPDPERNQTEEESLLAIKFKITADTKITKLESGDKENKQVFVNLEAIQLGYHLAIKADRIDITNKEEARAIDILILPPALVPPQGTSTPPEPPKK